MAQPLDELDYRIKLRNSTNRNQVVIFKTTPDLIENRNVNYKTVDPIHAPGQIYVYSNTSSRTFDMSSIKLVSRTQIEAEQNLNYLWTLRSWTMPEFGKDTVLGQQRENRIQLENERKKGQTQPGDVAQLRADLEANGGFGVDSRGQPPAVLLLSAYSADSRAGTIGHINQVPVVIQNISIPYPSDVDYIPSTSGVPMPTILTINMTLAETQSPRGYENFSLSDFKKGILTGF